MNNDDLIEEFLEHPDAQIMVEKVQSVLNKEKEDDTEQSVKRQ